MTRCFSFFGLAATCGLLLITSGCNHPSPAQGTAGTSEPAVAPRDRVMAGPATRKALTRTTTQPGWIEAFEETPLFPKVTGYVEEVLVDIGDKVSKDQTLVKLSIPEMQDDLAQKEAAVALAEAEVRQAEAAVQAAQAAAQTAAAKVQLAEAGIARAQADHARWQAEHTRIQSLAAERAVTEKLVDEALNQLRAAEAGQREAVANVASAQAAVTEAQAHVQKAEADQGAAAAKLRVAQADLARTKTLLGYTTLKAPFDGVITRRNVDTGDYVLPANGGGVKPLVAVARTDVVRVFVDVPELEASLVTGGEQGDPAIVTVQALGGKQFEAKVTRTSWSLDATNRALRTEIDIPNTDGVLRPGMYATATIVLDQRSEALALPIAALVREGAETYCCSVESGSIARRPIQLGLRVGEEVEVVSGLEAGQVVVLARADSLKPGQPVEVLPPEQK